MLDTISQNLLSNRVNPPLPDGRQVFLRGRPRSPSLLKRGWGRLGE